MVQPFDAAGLDVYLADFGRDVQVGLVVAKGIVDDSEEPILDESTGTFIGPATRVTVKTGAFSGLQEGATLKIDGVSYRVTRARRTVDGAFTEVFCAKL